MGEENAKNMEFCRRRQNKLKLIQKYMDFCRWRQNKDEAFVFEKSMIYDDKTIYIHEIYMLNRFLMVPCFENHQFDEFLKVYFGTNRKFRKFPKRKNNEQLLFDPMFKITQKNYQ